MPKKILTVGTLWPGNDAEYVDIDSDRSLLDGDIIVFQPGIPSSYYDYGEQHFEGKPTLGKSGSFRAVEHSHHWKSELRAAFDDGKTVILYLAKPAQAFVYTGKKDFSGTGRNRLVTHHVAPFSSYDALPVALGKITPKRGEQIKIAGPLGALAEYWHEFGAASSYQVYLDGELGRVVLTTKIGGKTVGAIGKVHKGHLVLLPPLTYDEDVFTLTDEEGNEYWNDKGVQFGAKLAAIVVRLDAQLRREVDATPAPDWANRAEFQLDRETTIANEVAAINSRMEDLRSRREKLLVEASREAALRRLLYETGADLEGAVLDALRLLGFSAESVKAGDSEFDAVFVSPEGDRYLGEAEGKDSKSLNIDKLSQLERNIQEDFAREDVKDPARGVLFGNAFRLSEPGERGHFFTEKCLSGAKRSGIALVRTPDLFRVAQFLSKETDIKFAQSCRNAIRNGAGKVVDFPVLPDVENGT